MFLAGKRMANDLAVALPPLFLPSLLLMVPTVATRLKSSFPFYHPERAKIVRVW